MSENIQQNIYIRRVNAVLDHIAAHLTDDLPLKTLAEVAGFSEYHFHRIFKAVTGETLNQYVWRIRVEHGAALLRGDAALPISEVAGRCGFKSLAAFSRAFKTRFGVAPTRWDRHTRLQDEHPMTAFPVYHITQLQTCADEFTVTFRQMPAQRLAYVRVYDSYADDDRVTRAYHRLIAWYLGRGGRLTDTTLYGMSMDDPDITPKALCRFDWCLCVPEGWQGDATVSVRDFPACLLATIKLSGDLLLEDRIWQYFWRYWLPRSRYQPLNLPSMEIYNRLPQDNAGEITWDQLDMDCAVPVGRL